MRLRCSHTTRYEYGNAVSFGPHLIYLRPREDGRQTLHSFSMTVSPAADLYETRDAYENSLTWAYFKEPASTLRIDTEFEVTTRLVPFQFIISPYAAVFPFDYEPVWRTALHACLPARDPGDVQALRDWSAPWISPGAASQTLAVLSSLAQGVGAALVYESRDLGSSRTSNETLRAGAGSCRDFACLLADVYRSWGMAARFVSGYLHAPAEGESRFMGSMHAWTEVYLPGAGWVGFDATHGRACDDGYVAVAHSPSPDLVNPIQGSFAGTVTAAPELWMLVQSEERSTEGNFPAGITPPSTSP